MIYIIGGVISEVEGKSVNAVELSGFQSGKMEIRSHSYICTKYFSGG